MYQKGAIKGGISLDDADEKPVYEKADLNNASRRRTNFEKDLDSMLFSGQPPPRRERKAPQLSKKPQVSNQFTSKNQSIARTADQSTNNKSWKQKTTEFRTTTLEQSQLSIQSSKSKKETAKRMTTTIEESSHHKLRQSKFQLSKFNEQKLIQSNLVVSQPPVSEEDISSLRYNQPKYIRKLKKTAKPFEENSNNRFSAQDVIRPIQCEKKYTLKEEKEDFIDKVFPPKGLFLGKNEKSQKVSWIRAADIFKRVSLGKYIDPNDIELGKMSSPNFMSILSCLAEKEENVKKLIENQTMNKNGFYYVRLNIASVWRYIIVDDHLPELEDEAVGARSFADSESDLWVSLIEKAYAKYFNGYEIFNRKIPAQCYLKDLTGAIVKNIDIQNDEIDEIIHEALSKNYIVIGVPNKRIEQLGFDSRFNLNILSIQKSGRLQLRNSWGTTVQRVKVPISHEGVFSLSLPDAQTYFDHILIAETNEGESISTIQSKHHKNFYSCYSFKVKQSLHGYLSITQWDEQLFPSHHGYKYSPFRVILAKKKKNQYIYVASGFSKSTRELNLKVDLLSGEYIVICMGDWVENIYDYNITLRGKELCKFERIRFGEFTLIASLLREMSLKEGTTWKKNAVDHYILYHADSNMLIHTVKNPTSKPLYFSQKTAALDFTTLSLLSPAIPENQPKRKFRTEMQEIKEAEINSYEWEVPLEAGGTYTWVFATKNNFQVDHPKFWGFK